MFERVCVKLTNCVRFAHIVPQFSLFLRCVRVRASLSSIYYRSVTPLTLQDAQVVFCRIRFNSGCSSELLLSFVAGYVLVPNSERERLRPRQHLRGWKILLRCNEFEHIDALLLPWLNHRRRDVLNHDEQCQLCCRFDVQSGQ